MSPVGATISALAAERPQGLAAALAGSAALSMVMLAGATATCYLIGRSRVGLDWPTLVVRFLRRPAFEFPYAAPDFAEPGRFWGLTDVSAVTSV
jgi:hypothetical protein